MALDVMPREEPLPGATSTATDALPAGLGSDAGRAMSGRRSVGASDGSLQGAGSDHVRVAAVASSAATVATRSRVDLPGLRRRTGSRTSLVCFWD